MISNIHWFEPKTKYEHRDKPHKKKRIKKCWGRIWTVRNRFRFVISYFTFGGSCLMPHTSLNGSYVSYFLCVCCVCAVFFHLFFPLPQLTYYLPSFAFTLTVLCESLVWKSGIWWSENFCYTSFCFQFLFCLNWVNSWMSHPSRFLICFTSTHILLKDLLLYHFLTNHSSSSSSSLLLLIMLIDSCSSFCTNLPLQD